MQHALILYILHELALVLVGHVSNVITVLCKQDLKWKVVLSDESRRSFASFMPSPVHELSLRDEEILR